MKKIDFLEHIQKQLLDQRKLIGKALKNRSLKGACNELQIREFLKTILGPTSGTKAGYGEIAYSNGTHSSQLDIIVYDSNIASPAFEYGDVLVVPSDAVKVAIEVKSIFAIRSSWDKKLAGTKDSFLEVKRRSRAKIFYFCFESDKYTIQEHNTKASQLGKYGIDEFFVLKAKDGYNSGELQRFVQAIQEACK